MCWKKNRTLNRPHYIQHDQQSTQCWNTLTLIPLHTNTLASALCFETDNTNCVYRCVRFCLVHNSRLVVDTKFRWVCVVVVVLYKQQASCMQTFAMLERWFHVSVVSQRFFFSFNFILYILSGFFYNFISVYNFKFVFIFSGTIFLLVFFLYPTRRVWMYHHFFLWLFAAVNIWFLIGKQHILWLHWQCYNYMQSAWGDCIKKIDPRIKLSGSKWEIN